MRHDLVIDMMFDVPKSATYDELLYCLKEHVRLLTRTEGLWAGHFAVYYARSPPPLLVRKGINPLTSQYMRIQVRFSAEAEPAMSRIQIELHSFVFQLELRNPMAIRRVLLLDHDHEIRVGAMVDLFGPYFLNGELADWLSTLPLRGVRHHQVLPSSSLIVEDGVDLSSLSGMVNYKYKTHGCSSSSSTLVEEMDTQEEMSVASSRRGLRSISPSTLPPPTPRSGSPVYCHVVMDTDTDCVIVDTNAGAGGAGAVADTVDTTMEVATDLGTGSGAGAMGTTVDFFEEGLDINMTDDYSLDSFSFLETYDFCADTAVVPADIPADKVPADIPVDTAMVPADTTLQDHEFEILVDEWFDTDASSTGVGVADRTSAEMHKTSDQIKSYESDSEHEADIEDFSDLEDSLTRQKAKRKFKVKKPRGRARLTLKKEEIEAYSSPGSFPPSYIKLKSSPIHGTGAFSGDMRIPKGRRIGQYLGIPRLPGEYDDKNDYVMEVNHQKTNEIKYVIDASDPKTSSWVRYVNSSMNSSDVEDVEVSNCHFVQYEDGVFLVSSCAIPPHTELLAPYRWGDGPSDLA